MLNSDAAVWLMHSIMRINELAFLCRIYQIVIIVMLYCRKRNCISALYALQKEKSPHAFMQKHGALLLG